MKKILTLLMSVLFVGALAACDNGGESTVSQDSVGSSVEEISSVEESSSEKGDETSSDEGHPHNLKRVAARSSKCNRPGNILHWYCETCDKYFADANGNEEISYEDTLLETPPHALEVVLGEEATCEAEGIATYYICLNDGCGNTFLDEEGTQPCDITNLTIGKLPHEMTYHAEVPVVGQENGVKEHWSCNVCNHFFADELATKELTEEDLVLYSLGNLVDFVVEVPVGKDPVILQLSDTQIIDAGQTRPGRDGVYWDWWATDKREERCYQYVRETIEATNPDFIFITGDVIYGEFDDNGSVWLDFIDFMDSFETPWSVVFGNHDNESKMGVDWQCEQLEKAEYCLFEQKTLSGNGNYSVGIMQGEKLTRAFYLLDSNGCSNASAESLVNGHTYPNFVGFKQDQIDWYTNQITTLKSQSPDTKISFAYHIQQAIFGKAYAKYGFNQAEKYQDINIDTMTDKTEGDFGYIGRQMKGPWDTNYSVYNGMKKLGTDSIFVGHEHCNSSSVVYEGIRFQFGQKSSEYDRFNSVSPDGTITGNYTIPAGAISLMGGTVIVLSETDGSIQDAYIYYCEENGGQIDWNSFITYEVNGLQKTDVTLESGVSMIGVQMDGQPNAYEVNVSQQGKIKINTALMRGKTTFTFTMYIGEITGKLAGMGPFAIRLKPDDGSSSGIAGVINASGKYYIDYDNDANATEEVFVKVGEWQTFTVDISSISETCTEFSFIIATGNTLYLRDMYFS